MNSVNNGENGTEAYATLAGHLGELRTRLIVCVAVLVAGSVVGYVFTPQIMAELLRRSRVLEQLVFLSPTEAFFARLKLSIAVGASLTFPVLMGEIWGFVSPAIGERSRRSSFIVVPITTVLFLTGAGFAYAGVFPYAIRFFLGFGSQILEPTISINRFVSFVIMLVLPFGLIFQLPVLVYFLAKAGVIGPALLARHRKFAILGIAVIAAVLTPGPDVFSQMMMGVPMYLLYELSIWIAWLVARRRTREEGE